MFKWTLIIRGMNENVDVIHDTIGQIRGFIGNQSLIGRLRLGKIIGAHIMDDDRYKLSYGYVQFKGSLFAYLRAKRKFSQFGTFKTGLWNGV